MVEAGGADKIILRQAADRMGREGNFAMVEAGSEVGVMSLLVGQPGQDIDKTHGLVKIAELEAPANAACFVDQLPGGYLRE